MLDVLFFLSPDLMTGLSEVLAVVLVGAFKATTTHEAEQAENNSPRVAGFDKQIRYLGGSVLMILFQKKVHWTYLMDLIVRHQQ